MELWVAVVACLLVPVSHFGAPPEKTVPAINEIEAMTQVGQQPYEFTWTQREENPHTLVDFEDLKAGNSSCTAAPGELRRSREQQMWGQYVAKFLFAGSSAKSRVVARPPKPIPIPGNSIRSRSGATAIAGGAAGGSPADVAILIMDARGKSFLSRYGHPLAAVVADSPQAAAGDRWSRSCWPASFSGIEISKVTNPEPRYFFCDSLAFYTEELKPLNFKPQPKRNLKPFRGQIAGLNTGPGTLPFPTREETILPRIREANSRSRCASRQARSL